MRVEHIVLYSFVAWRQKTYQGNLFGGCGVFLISLFVGFLSYLYTLNKPNVSVMGTPLPAPISGTEAFFGIMGLITLYLVIGGMYVHVSHKKDLGKDPGLRHGR